MTHHLTPLIAMPGMGELLVIFGIVLLLFGASRIPEIARSLGTGVREMKRTMRDIAEDERREEPKR